MIIAVKLINIFISSHRCLAFSVMRAAEIYSQQISSMLNSTVNDSYHVVHYITRLIHPTRWDIHLQLCVFEPACPHFSTPLLLAMPFWWLQILRSSFSMTSIIWLSAYFTAHLCVFPSRRCPVKHPSHSRCLIRILSECLTNQSIYLPNVTREIQEDLEIITAN